MWRRTIVAAPILLRASPKRILHIGYDPANQARDAARLKDAG
jgi:tRNA/tmRNA/rRNA uracil-C5-methylase (TrmA/RlmC/RlmD family)